jgi:Ca2+-binding RTX toxin-like protein
VVAGPVTLRSVPAGETVFIAFAALLAGAVDPDRDALRVVGLEVSAGSFEITAEGILYTAPAEPVGPVRFSFRISDGELSVRQTASSEIVDREPIIGTDGPDSIVGTPHDDRIDALGGNDTVVALGGRDVVVGGDGDDILDGGDGADTLFGGNGHDQIRAGSGDDIVWAGEGDDTVLGQGGNDVVFGEAGNDSLSGGEGADVAYGGTGADSLAGDAGNDALFGEDGDDVLSGGEGRDLAMGGSGADTLAGDAGDDVLHGDEGNDSLAGGTGHDMLLGGAGADTVDAGAGNDVVTGDLDTASDHLAGGEGQDTLDYSQATESLVIDLAQGRVSGAQTGEDTVEGFETIRAGGGDDSVIVGDAPVSLAGGGGDDLFTFRAPAVAESNPQAAPPAQEGTVAQNALAIHEILDFTVGDRIRVGSWLIERDDGEISGEARDGSSRASFELKSVGPGDTLDLQQPFRLRIEERDGHERTVVDVIVDGIDDPDYAIALNGLHSLVYSYVQQ